HTACSHDDPVPKFGPATRIDAPAYCGWLSTNERSSRHSPNSPAPNPVRSTRLSQSLGMIWSVSTSERSSGTARPVITRTGSISSSLEVGRAGQVPGDGGGGGDGGRHQMGAAP